MAETVNKDIADKLREVAELLQHQRANPFRVNAYRRAARTVATLPQDVGDIVARSGQEGLEALPNVGSGIAAAIAEIVRTGRWGQLDRLRGALDSVQLFQSVPGVGPVLAKRMHKSLHVDTLEALEAAAHDGRLENVPGVGPRRAAAIRASLSALLGQRILQHAPPNGAPGVDRILDVDREYREKGQAGNLPTIAPKRFNPKNESWLPVLHTRRHVWHFTALYSNTALAHELGRVQDWVVVYFYDQDHREGQYTVVTETRGPLRGKRVVRGREIECANYYDRERDRQKSSAAHS